jgi:hypothetical protein
MGMFHEQQEVGYAAGPPLFDQRTLHLAGFGIRKPAKTADFEKTHDLMLPAGSLSS